MSVLERLNVGVVGAAGRGAVFRPALEAVGAAIHAVCDIREERLDEAVRSLGSCEKYTDYEEMLERSDLDAVVIGTPMYLHATQSIMALERGPHVLCEVTAWTPEMGKYAGIVVDRDGEILAKSAHDAGVLVTTVDLDRRCIMRNNVVAGDHDFADTLARFRRADLYQRLDPS